MTRALLVALAIAGCAAPRPLDPKPPTLRLGTDARPLGYTLELTILPTESTFQGVAEIKMDVARTRVVWMHGTDLVVRSAEIRSGGRKQPARVRAGGEGFLGFEVDEPVSGHATLRVVYQGQLSEQEVDGAFRQKEGGDWYVFTQFQDTSARRVFPGFDEPGFKVPFRLTLRVPSGLVAAANAPEIRRRRLGELDEIVFAQTAPLPTYLVAFAIGPFDVVDAGRGGAGKTPLRVLAPRGRGAEAAYTAAHLAGVVDRLEAFFGVPYPYAKLDHVAIPQFGGAMENAGLISYWLPIILAPPAEVTPEWESSWGQYVIHEVAHHWFGNLVTLAWWDDIWLNESFAAWVEKEVGEAWRPDLAMDLDVAAVRDKAMIADGLATARRIRQPIETASDIGSAFDAITYDKGASVLIMLDQWVGRAAMRRAITSHFTRHRHGTATTADFLASVSQAAGRDVRPVFESFLDQPGVPVVSVALACDGRPRLELSQARLRPIGSKVAPARWRVPICARWPGGKACTLLEDERGELPLGKQCPAWVLANEGQRGYYRAHYTGELRGRLFAAAPRELLPRELAGLAQDQAALAEAGLVPLDELMPLAEALARGPGHARVSAALELTAILDEDLVAEELRPARDRFLARLYAEEARRLGWRRRPGEPLDDRFLRPRILPLASALTPALAEEARALAIGWLADPASLDRDLVDAVLTAAAVRGDEALFDRLLAAARTSDDRRTRLRLLTALASFRAPPLVARALALTLDASLEPRESYAVLLRMFTSASRRSAAWAFTRQNLDAILARLSRDAGVRLIGGAGHLCDEAEQQSVAATFADKAPSWSGGARALAQTLEDIELCRARVAALRPAAARFLRQK